jgi:SAM-dependent methyltransferase
VDDQDFIYEQIDKTTAGSLGEEDNARRLPCKCISGGSLKAKEMPKSEVIDGFNEWIYKLDILRCALELQIWEKVAAGKDTAEKMASLEGWDPTGTRMLLDAICSFNLLGKQEGRYSMVPESEAYLLPGKPTYKGNMLMSESNWEGNGKLAEAIRTGKHPIHYNAITEDLTRLWVADYARSWADPGSFLEAADKLWKSLEIQARDGLRILDIACGPAPKSLALARQHPGVKLAFLDREWIVQTACQAAAALGVKKQVKPLPGDLWSVDFGDELFDVVWLGNITHFFSPEENTRLFCKAFNALVHGGMIVINSAARRDGELPGWAELWLYAVSTGGAGHDFQEYKVMLENAGITDVTDINTGPIRAVKP